MAAAAVAPRHRLARASSSPLTTYKSRPRAPLHLAPLTRAPPLLYTAAPRKPAGARLHRPHLAADPLRRRLFFPFEQLGEIPCLSSLFWCLVTPKNFNYCFNKIFLATNACLRIFKVHLIFIGI
jgi:hypothetical protein